MTANIPPKTNAFREFWLNATAALPTETRRQGARVVGINDTLLAPPMVTQPPPQVIVMPPDYYRSQDHSSPEGRKRSRPCSPHSSSPTLSDNPKDPDGVIPSISEWFTALEKVIPASQFDGCWIVLREKFRVGKSLNLPLSTLACIPTDNIYAGYHLDMGEFGMILAQLEVASKQYRFKLDGKPEEKRKKRSRRY